IPHGFPLSTTQISFDRGRAKPTPANFACGSDSLGHALVPLGVLSSAFIMDSIASAICAEKATESQRCRIMPSGPIKKVVCVLDIPKAVATFAPSSINTGIKSNCQLYVKLISSSELGCFPVVCWVASTIHTFKPCSAYCACILLRKTICARDGSDWSDAAFTWVFRNANKID